MSAEHATLDLLAAARIDGCTEFGAFRRIALPLAAPITALVGFFSFVANWTNFFLPAPPLSAKTSRSQVREYPGCSPLAAQPVRYLPRPWKDLFMKEHLAQAGSRDRVQQVGWHVGSFQGDEVAGVRHLGESGGGE